MSKDPMRAAAAARGAAMRARGDRPQERQAPDGGAGRARVRVADTGGWTLRLSNPDSGESFRVVGGYASVTESPYEMRDAFGPYTEVVSAGAFGPTLAGSPLVEFALNHGRGGQPSMAGTRNGTLALSEDETGLAFEAQVDPARSDVADMLLAMERGDLAEASFKFMIVRGLWSPDFDQFRIDEVDLDGGDVSAVNFGANPAASSGVIRSSKAQRRHAELVAAVRAAMTPAPAPVPVRPVLRDHAPLVRRSPGI